MYSTVYRRISYIQTRGLFRVVSILLDDALRLGQICLLRVRLPPVPKIALHVKLTTLIVEAMGDLVTNDIANSAEVHVLGSLGVEEVSLQDAGREFYFKNG